MNFSKIFINNEWINSSSNDYIEVEDPFKQQIITKVPACNSADVDFAAQSAKNAFKIWANVSLEKRIEIMENFLKIFQSYEDTLVDIIVQELGCPITFTRLSHVQYQYTRTRSYIDLAPSVPMIEIMKASTTYREPVGVIGCLTPWNYPLGQIIQKVVPAILMGNTIVLKPSQHTPLSAYYLADAFSQAGLPAGVFNLLPGRGSEVGNAIADNNDIDMISFTGSTTGGTSVGQRALSSVKRLSLELGGKSPYIILPNANYEPAIRICFNSIFMNSGQTCTAFSRLLIPYDEKEKIEKTLVDIAKEYTVGNPWDANIKLGGLINAKQYNKVCNYIQQGIHEGAKLLCGGLPKKNNSYQVPPTIFTNVDNNSMSIAKEEIFGPVLCVITYKTIDEAIKIANSTCYGLNAGVYGQKELAIEVAHKIQSGNIYINDSPRDTDAPFGGYKFSGFGREGGIYGMLEFTQQKALFDTKL